MTVPLDLSEWKSLGRYQSVLEHQIFTVDSGPSEKPVLLCIHGFPTASIDWQPMWQSLTQRFRCITLDLLGYGLSSKPKNMPITLMEQADICEALLTSLSVNEFHILAHDYGVSVAQELLARTAERRNTKEQSKALSCVFLNGGLYPEMHRPRLIQKLLMSPIGALIAKLTSYKTFLKNLRTICTQPLLEEDLLVYWELMIRDGGRKVLPALIRYMPERVQYTQRWGAATNSPPCPTCLINGVDDPISGGHLADAYESRAERASVTRLAQTGHYPQVEAPQKVLDVATAFWVMNSIQ